jgi:hypothetical protein
MVGTPERDVFAFNMMFFTFDAVYESELRDDLKCEREPTSGWGNIICLENLLAFVQHCEQSE